MTILPGDKKIKSQVKTGKKTRGSRGSPCTEALAAAGTMAASMLGRPRSFDMEEVLDKATNVFLELGYVGCSLADLERATGVSRMSLYNAIGDKEAVFLAVLRRFTDRMTQFVLGQLPEQTLDEVIALFRAMHAGDWPINCEKGCLVVTTSLERDKMSDVIHEELLRDREGQISVFRGVLEAEKKRGRLKRDIDPSEGATFIVNTYWGAAATARLYDDMAPVKAPIAMLARTLESWKSG